MPLTQSDHAKGRKQAPIAAEAGNVVAARYEIDLAATTGKIELGILPAYSRLVDATLITDGVGGAVTAGVGLMSGTPGDNDDTRTVGTEFFAAASVAAAGVTRASATAGFLLGTEETDRAVGMTVSASATGKVVLVLQYAANGDY